MPRRCLLLLLLVGALASLVVGCGGPPPPSADSKLLGQPMREVHARALDGESVDTAGARGRVVVVEFFGKYCEPCKRALPALEALHRAEPEVLVVGVAEDTSEAEAREMVEMYHLTFKVVNDRDKALSGRYRVSEIPATFVASPKGVIRWVGGEAIGTDELSRVVAAVRRPAE
jgi:peroxiredoxin